MFDPDPTRYALEHGNREVKPKVIGNEAEQILAYQCLADKLPPFEQNYRFHPTRKFELDIAFVPQKVGAEIQGGIYDGRAHGSIRGIMRDMQKSNLLVLAGWRVLRYTPAEVKCGAALEGIKLLLAESKSCAL